MTPEEFVNGILNFVPDLKLFPVSQQVRKTACATLAASGNGNDHHSFRKIGLLTDPDMTVTARIMENRDKKEYEIFFLPEEHQTLSYSILSNPKSGRFFIINENEYTAIPKSLNIDPLKDELVISFAKEIFNFNNNVTGEVILVGEEGNRLVLSFDKEQKCIVCKLVSTDDINHIEFKKLLLYSLNRSKKIVRLVPLINGRAVIPVPQNMNDKFVICLYY